MTSGNLLPTKILVSEVIKKDKETKSGIIISATLQKEPNISGDVVLVGSGTPQNEMLVSVGDRILFNQHAFQRLNIDEKPYMLVDIRDVLFMYKPESSL